MIEETATARLAGVFEDGSPEWHAQRATGIGGSDIASVAMIPGAFKSRYMLWMEKMGRVVPEEPEPAIQEMFDWGHRMEPVISEAFQDRTGLKTVDTGSWVSKSRSWALTNPDRLIVGDHGELVSGLEIKNSGHGYGFDEGPPPKYVAQCVWSAGVLGLSDWYLAALISGRQLRWWHLDLNPTGVMAYNDDGDVEFYQITFPHLMQEAEQFVNLMNAGTPPPIDGGTDTYEHFKAVETGIDPGASVEVPIELAARLHHWDSQQKHAEEESRRAKSETMSLMGEAKPATVNGERAAYRQQSGKATKPSLYLSRGAKAKERFLSAYSAD